MLKITAEEEADLERDADAATVMGSRLIEAMEENFSPTAAAMALAGVAASVAASVGNSPKGDRLFRQLFLEVFDGALKEIRRGERRGINFRTKGSA